MTWMKEERPIVICIQVIKMPGPRPKHSTLAQCSACPEPVWFGRETPRPEGYRICCFDCAVAEARRPGATPIKFHPITEDQREVIARELRASDDRISELEWLMQKTFRGESER